MKNILRVCLYGKISNIQPNLRYSYTESQKNIFEMIT